MRTLPLLSLFLALSAQAAISVTGVTNQQKATGTRTITVANPAGFVTTATLNGAPFPVGTAQAVSAPRYYALVVSETPAAGGATTTQTIQFIIQEAERLETENGIPPFTPYPVVNSATAEFTNAVLRVLTPAAFPAGYDLPLAARVETPAGDPLFLNGWVTSPDVPGAGIQIRRGFGSSLWTLPAGGGTRNLRFRVADRETTRTVALETNTVWTGVSGLITGNATWPANGRVFVNGTLTIGTNATLTVQAGCVVRLGPSVDVDNFGRLNITGTWEQPVVFMPNAAAQPWGGVWVKPGGRVDATALILTGSGEDQSWFSTHSGFSTHLTQQAAFLFDQSTSGAFTNSVITHLRGQVFNGKAANVRLIRSQYQRATTGGELNDGSFRAERSHWSEFPDTSKSFVDGDNDGIYLNGGQNSLDRCSWGWCKDDGIDSGGSNIGHMIVRDSWGEGCFHEAESMSGNKTLGTTNTVFFGNGQAQEAGYNAGGGAPRPLITNCLLVENMVGLRIGDNYVGGFNYVSTFLSAFNNISIYNLEHDVWGMMFHTPAWTYASAQMNVTNNFLTAANPRHPANTVWNPAADAHRLAAFRAAPGAPVGVGLMYEQPQGYLSALGTGFRVGLSSFAEFPVSVDWRVLGRAQTGAPEAELAAGTVSFLPGQMVKSVPLAAGLTNGMQFVRVALVNPVGAEVTHGRDLWFIAASSSTQNLIPQFGSSWKYLDQNIDPGATWKTLAHNDSAWSTGNAELGYGNGDEATVVSFGTNASAKYAACFFRKAFTVSNPGAWTNLQMVLRYDDAAAVHLNGTTVYRTATLATNATHTTYVTTTSANNATVTVNIPVSLLVNGANIIAAQVHQANATSSDLSFALGLTLQRAPVLTVAPLQTAANDGVILFDPPSAVLEQSDDLRTWTPAPTGGTSPLPFPDGVDRRYYRLSQ